MRMKDTEMDWYRRRSVFCWAKLQETMFFYMFLRPQKRGFCEHVPSTSWHGDVSSSTTTSLTDPGSFLARSSDSRSSTLMI
jgi:hypothetical protein